MRYSLTVLWNLLQFSCQSPWHYCDSLPVTGRLMRLSKLHAHTKHTPASVPPSSLIYCSRNRIGHSTNFHSYLSVTFSSTKLLAITLRAGLLIDAILWKIEWLELPVALGSLRDFAMGLTPVERMICHHKQVSQAFCFYIARSHYKTHQSSHKTDV